MALMVIVMGRSWSMLRPDPLAPFPSQRITSELGEVRQIAPSTCALWPLVSIHDTSPTLRSGPDHHVLRSDNALSRSQLSIVGPARCRTPDNGTQAL